jgi:tetraacyldisaccharide 4'-kinase
MSLIEQSWQTRGLLACLLWPLSLIYRTVLWCRRLAYGYGWLCVEPVSLPVVVVGNLSVGGTGKTPLCAYLVSRFEQAGWRPAIVSRGYGGERHEQPYSVGINDTAARVGDEPLMLLQQTGVPVCVCVDRAAAVRHIEQTSDANIVFSDDGLQHLAMPRVAEIAVIDSVRGLGNRWLLPAGPLRDLPSVLRNVDLIALQSTSASAVPGANKVASNATDFHPSLSVVAMGRSIESVYTHTFSLQATHAVELISGKRYELSELDTQRVHAVAGIGHPDRFFRSLQALGFSIEPHPKPDHHSYTATDLRFDDDLAVLVTAKDAVKLRSLGALPATVYEICTRVMVSDNLDQQICLLEQALQQRKIP